MGGKLMNTADYEKIVTDALVFGKPVKQIAVELERKDTVVFNVLNAFNATKEQDWDRAVTLLTTQNFPLSVFTWAGDKLGIALPPTLEVAYKQRCERAAAMSRDRYAKQKAEKEPAPVQTPEPLPESEPKKEDNTGLYMIKLLEAVNRQNELLEQLYDVVIPKWTGDMKDNVNVNADMLNQSLKRIDDKLEAIKINVRKRGL